MRPEAKSRPFGAITFPTTHTQTTNTRTTTIKTNTNIIEHAVEVHAFSQANLKSVETRKALYDGLERDLKAIFREVTGYDLHEGYYLHFNKNDDGSWKTDFHVSIRQDDQFWKASLYPKNRELDTWVSIPAIEKLHDRGVISNFPCHLCAIFSVEAEVGERWAKKTKLSVGQEYGQHHYCTEAERAQKRNGDWELPRFNSYSQFKQVKGSQEYAHTLIKTNKAYLVFKLYVAQFYARIEELKAGYEQAKAIAEPHKQYFEKLERIKARQNEINNALHNEFNPDSKPEQYRPEYVNIGNERIYVANADLQSVENIDITAQILELVSKLKFKAK